jgi:hypothetical protein
MGRGTSACQIQRGVPQKIAMAEKVGTDCVTEFGHFETCLVFNQGRKGFETIPRASGFAIHDLPRLGDVETSLALGQLVPVRQQISDASASFALPKKTESLAILPGQMGIHGHPKKIQRKHLKTLETSKETTEIGGFRSRHL